MDKITVSVRSLLLAGLVVLAVVTAYLLGSGGDPVSAPATASTTTTPAQAKAGMVRMVGAGEATAVPDQLSFGLTVTAKRADLDDALAAASASTRRVLAALSEYGVEPRDVQTTGLSMYPEYDYPSYGPRVLTGYRVTQRARVHVDELADGGRAVAAAIQAGGNDVRAHDIRLQVGDPEAVLAEARESAVDAATAKAEQYADATGQSLGRVVTVREVGDGNGGRDYRPQFGNLRESYDAAALATGSLPIRAGRDELKVRVEVVWEFE
jgi:uncharacterized protein YggE